MKHPTRLLLVECRDRLGSDDLAARGVHGGIRDIRIDHPQCGLDHVAAVVDLGDDAIGLVLAIERNRVLRPFGRRIMTGTIGQHITVPASVLAGDDDAGFVRVLAGRRPDRSRRRSAPSPGMLSWTASASLRSARGIHKGTRYIVEQLGVELLPAEPGALVFA